MAPVTSEPCGLDPKTWSSDLKPEGALPDSRGAMEKGSAPLPWCYIPRHQEGIQTGVQMATSGEAEEGEGDYVAANKLTIAWTTLLRDALHNRVFLRY
jgi:hypothetical protein